MHVEYIECAVNKVIPRYRETRGRGFKVSSDFYGSLFAESTIGRRESVVCISKLRCAQNYTEPINDRVHQNRKDLT